LGRRKAKKPAATREVPGEQHSTGPAMSKADEKAAREQRLATKLRENLKRRKGQVRARRAGEAVKPAADGDKAP